MLLLFVLSIVIRSYDMMAFNDAVADLRDEL
jgi:hypothetical protein